MLKYYSRGHYCILLRFNHSNTPQRPQFIHYHGLCTNEPFKKNCWHPIRWFQTANGKQGGGIGNEGNIRRTVTDSITLSLVEEWTTPLAEPQCAVSPAGHLLTALEVKDVLCWSWSYISSLCNTHYIYWTWRNDGFIRDRIMDRKEMYLSCVLSYHNTLFQLTLCAVKLLQPYETTKMLSHLTEKKINVKRHEYNRKKYIMTKCV